VSTAVFGNPVYGDRALIKLPMISSLGAGLQRNWTININRVG
jgi:hypothetical protein